MSTTDPISDMLSRIRNAILTGKNQVSLPHSNLKEKVAQVLVDSGFLTAFKTELRSDRKELLITIYEPERSPNITELARISRPGRRQYVSAKEIPRVKGGRGLVVVSTSQGIMNGMQAKQKGLGGELICEVY